MKRHPMKSILPLFVYIFLFDNLSAQDYTVSTILDKDSIQLGRQVNLKFLVIKGTDDIIRFPSIADSLTKYIEVIGQPKIDSVKLKNNKEQITQTLSITSFEIGVQFIPPQPIVRITPQGRDTLFSDLKFLKIAGVAIDTTGEIRDIKNIEKVKLTFNDIKPYLFLFVGLLAFGVCLFFLIRFIKKKKFESIETVVEAPHIVALRELDKLKAQKLWQQKRLKEYYTRLTEIIRTYIENKYDILAMEKTTKEILEVIQLKELDKTLPMNELTSLLNLSDLIKFAKGDANPEENILHLENAYNFIKISCKNDINGHSPVVVNKSNNFMDFISEGIDYAIEMIKDNPVPLVPFAIIISKEKKITQKFTSDKYQEAIKMAENFISDYSPVPEMALYIYDGIFTMNNIKTDAIYIKAFNSNELKGLTFVQRYKPKTKSTAFERIEIPILTGKVDNILKSNSKV